MTAVVMRIEHGRNPPKVIALALVAPRSRTFHIIFVRRCQRCGQKAVLNARLIKLMIEDFGCAPVVFIYIRILSRNLRVFGAKSVFRNVY